MDELYFYVNGIEVRERFATCEPDQTLLEYLRRQMNLCGTKLACGEGGCGACTVMVSELRNGKVVHSSVNACLTPIGAVGNCLGNILLFYRKLSLRWDFWFNLPRRK